MSEESNIAAATLLAPLLSAPTTGIGQADAVKPWSAEFLSSDEKTNIFGELLLSNIDGAIDSSGLNAMAIGFGYSADRQTTSNELNPDNPTTAPQLESPLPAIPTLTGNHVPQPGNFLPHHAEIERSETITNLQLSENQANSQVRGSNGVPKWFGDLGDSIDSVPEEAHGLRQATGHDGESGSVTERGASAAENQTVETTPFTPNMLSSGAGASSLSDSNAASRRELAGTADFSNSQSGFSDQTLADQMAGEGGFEQPAGTEEPGLEVPLEPRSSQRAVAEFALNDNRSAPTSGPSSTSMISSAELGATPTSTLTQSAGSTPITPSLTLALPVDRNLAGQQVAQQVANFVRQGNEFAELNLSPPHLGKISVRITMQNEQASIVLNASLPEIREIIESSLPRLSELLEDAGLSLANADVSSGNQQADANNPRSANLQEATPGAESNANDNTTSSQSAVQQPIRGLIDAYA